MIKNLSPQRAEQLPNDYTPSMLKTNRVISAWIKTIIIVSWTVLFIALLRRDVFLKEVDLAERAALQQAESEEYQSIYFKGAKIGYVINSYSKTINTSWSLKQHATMELNVAGTRQNIDLKLQASLSETNQLEDFSFSFRSPFYTMNAEGTVRGNIINYILETGSNRIEDILELGSQPQIATTRRAYLLASGIKKGEKRKIVRFDPFTLTGRQSVVEYYGQESLQIRGRILNLHHFSESFSGTRVSFWLNDSGTVIKEESPAGFVFIKEPKFKALGSKGSSGDILSAVAVQLSGPMPKLDDSLEKMSYRLDLPDDLELDIEGHRQTLAGDILTITKEDLPESSLSPNCKGLGAALLPTPYIQSDSLEISTVAEKIISRSSPPLEQVRQLGNWVHDNLLKRPVLGLPDALSTLKSGQGDCNEHAALFAALGRSVGIPTRIVAGVTYHKEAFYYHAWNEVCVGADWISIDTTTNQLPADLSHIRFVEGEMEEQLRIGGLLGRLKIAPLAENESN